MAEKRKLLNEIDKCFKKVDEGFEIFDEIMEKMNEANSENQLLKFQDDLKKEIKKLQRLRDQIKMWQNSSDIKDKDNLAKYRKMIEMRMESFKEIEKENKTKPYSKQGLSIEDELDPKEKEKLDTMKWLNTQIKAITEEIDRTESKLETLNSEAKNIGRKRGNKEDNSLEEELKKHLERVKFHLLNLEVVLRLITNDKLEISEVLTKLKDPIETYIEALDPENEIDLEGLDPEDIYEELDLATYIPQLAVQPLVNVEDEIKSQEQPQPKTPVAFIVPSAQTTVPSNKAFSAFQLATSPAVPLALQKIKEEEVQTQTAVVSPWKNTSPVAIALKKDGQLHEAQHQEVSAAALIDFPPISSATKEYERFHTSLKMEPSHPFIDPATKIEPSHYPNSALMSPNTPLYDPKVPPPLAPSPSGDVEVKKQEIIKADVPKASEIVPKKLFREEFKMRESNGLESSVFYSPKDEASILAQGFSNVNVGINQLTSGGNAGFSNVHRIVEKVSPWLGASPLGMAQVTDEMNYQLNMLKSAMACNPAEIDSEKTRTYMPKAPCKTPSYYPQEPHPMAGSFDYYKKLLPETLFFCFYYMEGSQAQLLAAKALKESSWRFHTKFLMWFQRLDQPKAITEEFEQGAYLYFDFEKWAMRRKDNFIFEYKYLEDKKL